VAVMRKSRELATVSYLFAPVLAFLIQLAIALHILFRLGDDWANLAIYGLTLALIMSVGNSVATTRRDSFGGLRNRWSVSSRTVWFRTQRLHGRTLVFGGLASLALIPLASFGIALLALLVTYIASIIAATAYSAYLANTLEPAL